MAAPVPTTGGQALAQGAIDAAGFVAGGLAGWGLGRWLGLDLLASGSGPRQLAGWLILMAGLGLGKWLALRWQRRLQAGRAP